MAGRLVVLDRAGRAKNKSFALGSGMCTLGRSAACDVRVLLPDVSPHHATVTVHANQTVVRNVGSGITLVNGAPISVHALQHGDEMALGGRRLRWEYDAPQASRRGKAQPVLALPPAPARAARRGTLAAAPRAPDRDVQLALELRHRASVPASSGTGGKQVAIVQPQRRNTDNQNEASRPEPPRAESASAPASAPASARASAPASAPAPRKASTSARLHTPTKATLWIESRRGRARAASLRAAPPLRLAVLRGPLAPAPRRLAELRVTKIQAPLHLDRTKRAAIMLMTGHASKSEPPNPPHLGARPPSFAAEKRSPAARTPRGRPAMSATNESRHTPDATNESPSTLDATNESRSRATPQIAGTDTPGESARENDTRNSGKRSVSILEITDSSRCSPAPPKSALKPAGRRSRKAESIKFDLSNLENRSRDDADVLAVSSTNGAAAEDATPRPRRSIHSRSGRTLDSWGSPTRSPAESSDTFVTESRHSRRSGSPRRRDLEAYSVVDLVSLEGETSRSVYGSAGSPGRSTPRGRSRLDDGTGTIDSIEDDSPESSRRVGPATTRSLDDGFPESPRTYVSLDSSSKSLGNLSPPARRGFRGRLDDGDSSPLGSPRDVSLVSVERSPGRKLSGSKRGSRSLNVGAPPSPTDVSLDSMNKSPGKKLSTSSRGSRLEDETRFGSPKDEASPEAPRNSRRTLSITIRDSSDLNNSPSLSEVDSPKLSGKSAPKRASRSQLDNSVSLESRKNSSANSSRSSLGNKLSAPKRGSRGRVDDSITSPNTSRRSAGKTTSNRGSSVLESPKNASAISSRKSVEKPISKRDSRNKLSIVFSPKPVASESPKENISANSTRNSLRKSASTSKRASRSKLIDSVLSSPNPSSTTDALVDSTRQFLRKLSSSKRSRSQPDESAPTEFSKDLHTSRKSRTTTPSTSSRRTRSLPLESPKGDTSRDSARKPRFSAISTSKRSSCGPNTSLPESPLKASPAKSPTRSPKSPNVSSKTKNDRKTLTLSINRIDNNVSTGGEVTPEERGSPENAGTPVLSIRSLLEASVSDSPGEPPRKRGRLSDKRTTFANARGAVKDRGALRSESSMLTRDTGDVTPTGVAEPTPEAVKSKHSSAKKSRSRRSIIDTLDDSGLVKHLFNSPVKRKLSQSMSEFSRRLGEPETSPNVSGVKRSLTNTSPKNELKDSHDVRHSLRTPRARRSIKNDSTDVRGVKVVFAAAPRDSLGDVRGVKRTFRASPDDDLRRVSGAKDSFRRNKPRDDLSDVRGVRELFKRGQKDELNATGVKEGLRIRSPKNDLRDVRGVKELFRQPKPRTSPNVSGVARLLDEPAPAEVMFDRLVGEPPVRATYSKTFIARSAKKPARRRRATSLGVPVDVLVNDVEDWLESELRKRLNDKTARALQKLATDTVAGGTPIIASRSRNSVAPGRSAAENYAEHTLPIKKRSLEKAPEPRSAKKRNLPLKKRALVHSTPVKGRESRAADATLARVSPIACDSAVEEPTRGSPTPRDSPNKPKQIQAFEKENVVEKNESIKPSPKKTRARRTEKVANNQRLTRARGGKKVASPKKAIPEKALAAKKAPVIEAFTPKKSPTPVKASNAKVPTPTEVAPKEPTPKASRSKKVAAPTKVATSKSTAPKKATRSKKVFTPAKVTPKKSPTPKKATRTKKVLMPVKVTPKNSPTPKKATRSKKVPMLAKVTPKKSPTPTKATRAKARDKVPAPKQATPKATRTKKVLTAKKVTPQKSPALQKATRGTKIRTPVKAATTKKPTVVAKKPRAVVATASPKATRGRKILKSPVDSPPTKRSRTKKAQSPAVTVPVEKRSRKRATPEAVTPKKRGRVSFVLPKPSPVLKPQPAARSRRLKNETPEGSPKRSPARGKSAAAGDAPGVKPGRGREAAPTPREGGAAAPASPKAKTAAEKETGAPEPKRGRRAPPTPKRKAPTPKRKKAEVPPSPEPRREKAEVPEPGRAKAKAASKRGRETAPVSGERSESRARSAKRAGRAPKEAPKPKGKKATAVPVVEESAPGGRKRKNDATSVDEHQAPSPKKPRASRAAAPPPGGAASRGRGRRR